MAKTRGVIVDREGMKLAIEAYTKATGVTMAEMSRAIYKNDDYVSDMVKSRKQGQGVSRAAYVAICEMIGRKPEEFDTEVLRAKKTVEEIEEDLIQGYCESGVIEKKEAWVKMMTLEGEKVFVAKSRIVAVKEKEAGACVCVESHGFINTKETIDTIMERIEEV